MKIRLLPIILCYLVIIGCDTNQTASNTSETVQPEATLTTTTQDINEQQPIMDAPANENNTVVEDTTPSVAITNQVATLSGEQVYKKSCATCHNSGVAGAPKLGDATAWSTRTSKGTNILYQSAKTGVPGTAMMAKGTCNTCSDEELNAAVDYMIANSQ